ncbi:MAG: Ribonuclease H [Candidatus Falkowbacteria bacterium GW2011_GWC2_38_22]|uniref:Ribonuclease H n=1 Tax=Candidatus Falkowbacteria bacterium GW2011_GWE1_38_31 TaxID=1618638 RepID=A0A0G0JU09_9BACT|nr:MAG: Ribonuclease H [Candidatus Falkowbacteria bacterium GW2011_GWF2_38_1205]KKQ62143.1 MAG: Ribonuclease H [Candidatus Falkowbacteria bacterium GW2011_GWC2_38_22]KKQ64293.1 MAG: Ribonuclease H [Candidatus Falkowbacteria bacterium GW2011_GWF1_38_22]KKQ66270.1 MAG: Ribonuclease H [Candidatus Falkowbacteria bacterium GW2011_GWE2_38_254]KKQ70998.1 MAG: Ribonuclease H [Candidatus Falkowbacteria bacterium GW2011_GWE1_38_31]KKQ73507.1 MAG: Ribonuclease H [Candidatus Falkowbacteria bacterium GW201
MLEKVKIFTDGGARGNPGPSGIGVVVYDTNDNILKQKSEFIGKATNNQAEYRAVIAAFELLDPKTTREIDFYLDSELVVKQLKGEYRVKNADLAPLFVKVHNQIILYKKVTFRHIRREMNKEADRLANIAMDAGK